MKVCAKVTFSKVGGGIELSVGDKRVPL